MLVTDWGLVSACEGPPLRVLRRVLSTNPAEKGPDLGMMGARSVNRRHFRLSMLSFEAEAAVQAEPVPPVLPVLYLDDVMCAVMKPEKLLVHRTEIANGDTVFAVHLHGQKASDPPSSQVACASRHRGRHLREGPPQPCGRAMVRCGPPDAPLCEDDAPASRHGRGDRHPCAARRGSLQVSRREARLA